VSKNVTISLSYSSAAQTLLKCQLQIVIEKYNII